MSHLHLRQSQQEWNKQGQKSFEGVVVHNNLIFIVSIKRLGQHWVELGKNEQRSKFLVDAVKQMRQGNDVFSKTLQDKLEVMNKSPQKKVVTHRFEPTSKNILLFIGGLVLSLVISIWGNLTQWREHQDWEEADLKYRALKMVLPADDPNIRYIEKHFNVQRDENVINDVRNRVTAYEDSVRHSYEMYKLALYKYSIANHLLHESKITEVSHPFISAI